MTHAKKPDLLRDNELIYGRLLTVDEPHLIDRYNKALAAFGLKPTKLKSFQIDRTGFSPSAHSISTFSKPLLSRCRRSLARTSLGSMFGMSRKSSFAVASAPSTVLEPGPW